MARTIAISGKGGTGKTTIAALLIRCLIGRSKSAVLAVDADANACLGLTLGIEPAETVADLRDEALQKKANGGIKVKIGDVPHPMEQDHYIEWIEILADGKAYRQFLSPGQPAEAVFNIEAATVTAREHCNKHGLWEA